MTRPDRRPPAPRAARRDPHRGGPRGGPREAPQDAQRGGLREAQRGGPLRLHIDWTGCDGRGLCAELLPELLDRDEWGYPVPRDGSREPIVPAALRKHAERAVSSCPLVALSLLGQ